MRHYHPYQYSQAARTLMQASIPGMLTKAAEVRPGGVYFYAYGRLNQMERIQVRRVGLVYDPSRYPYFTITKHFDHGPGTYESSRHYGDCGLDCFPNNHNRIFYSEETATKWLELCRAVGVR